MKLFLNRATGHGGDVVYLFVCVEVLRPSQPNGVMLICLC